MSDQNQTYFVPMLTCKNWTDTPGMSYGLGIAFCIAEKLVGVISVLIFCLTIQQMYIHNTYYKVIWADFRMLIFTVCLLSSVDAFIHYQFLLGEQRGRTFFLIEIFRFIEFFIICYYYCNKASSLLPNKKLIKIILRLIFVIIVTLILTLGGIILQKIDVFISKGPGHGGMDPSKLCTNRMFEFFRFLPLIV